MNGRTESGDEALYVISKAAELAGMHPQTLRQYDRLGLVTPHRTKGRGRRYSSADIARLRQIQDLSQVGGINLAGIQQIIALQDEIRLLRQEVHRLLEQSRAGAQPVRRVFAADSRGHIRPRASVDASTAGDRGDSRALVSSRSVLRNLPPELLKTIAALMQADHAESATEDATDPASSKESSD